VIELLHMDCMAYMKTMPDSSVDAIITDPPYFKVKQEAWDNQWDKPIEFLAWISRLCVEFQRILKPNGSLYLFASPQMGSRVELEIGKHFNVLNSITWRKGEVGKTYMSMGNRLAKDGLRSFFPASEKIIFAEHYGADNMAKGESGYDAKCDKLRGFVFEPLRLYLATEWERAGLTRKDADAATGSQMAGHWFSSVQWTLPTKENYQKLQARANQQGSEHLRREYEDLRREYEDLRREYEDLRRYFNMTPRDQWSDVWDFDPVPTYVGKHPCEKPQALLQHMLKISVKPGALVFDPFIGSGSMAIACHRHGARFVGTELDADYYAAAVRRLKAETSQIDLFGVG
jgi:adenine-specific DNA-methyltransferase